ncbi:MAG: FAD-dependent oxidoreductase [Ferruginibacter sp.]
MKKINTLVVGQGLAGSLVAYMLHLRKISFTVIDPARANTSSLIAAGMFSPVSGKRKTIQPIVQQQIPFAIKIYKEIEQLLNATILHLNNIYQVFNSVAEQNELIGKLANADYAKYILTGTSALPNIKQEIGAYEITHSGWVDCELLISRFAQWLMEHDAFIKAGFLYEDLQLGNGGMKYHGLEFNNIVFCEGWLAVDNPFFNNENIIPCKGDILSVKYYHLPGDHIIKKNGIYLIPAGNNLFRAGSTYQWNNNSTQPDEWGKKLIEDQLNAMLKNKYITINHRSAIRPTTQNREVIAKQHASHAGMFMLNGLGTKGILQGPWWARHIVEILDP